MILTVMAEIQFENDILPQKTISNQYQYLYYFTQDSTKAYKDNVNSANFELHAGKSKVLKLKVKGN